MLSFETKIADWYGSTAYTANSMFITNIGMLVCKPSWNTELKVILYYNIYLYKLQTKVHCCMKCPQILRGKTSSEKYTEISL
jgi:hypothetical protein